MEIFQTIRRHLTLLGIDATQSALNWKLLLGFLLFGDVTIGCALYLVYLAETMIEYMQCFCVISGTIEIGLCFVATVLQKQLLFDYIDHVEKLINTSKFIWGVVFEKFIETLTKVNVKIMLLTCG